MEKVVKYDQEALTKAWDYLAKSPSDDDKKIKKIQLFLGTFLPLDKGRNTAILGPTDYFSDARTYWVVREEKKSQRNTTQKTPNNSKKSSPVGSNSRNEVCVIITDFTYGTKYYSPRSKKYSPRSKKYSPRSKK